MPSKMPTSNSNPNLTNTTSQNSFTLDRPNNSHVTFEFNLDPSRPGMTQITLPAGSTWGPTAHWHESYTEYLLVKQGRVTVILNGTTHTVTPASGVQTVHKSVIHEWQRADTHSPTKDPEDVIVEEWTDPADGSKQVMFRNLFSTLGDSKSYWGWRMGPQILLTLYTYDNYQVFTPGVVPWWGTLGVTKGMFWMGRWVAWGLGLRAWYEEYTPGELRGVAAELAGEGGMGRKDR